MSQFIEVKKQEFAKAIEHLEGELRQIRTGRATPALVDEIEVEAYGAKTPLKAVASISTPDAQTINIEPWDKSVLKDIERALQTADIGISPVVDKDIVRLSMPAMTEENRKELVKQIGQKIEQTRVTIRNVREGVRDEILKMEKNKEINEDERYKLQEELDKLVGEMNGQIAKTGEDKEKDIMTI